MKNMQEDMVTSLSVALAQYTFTITIKATCFAARQQGIIKIAGLENIPKKKIKIIVAQNHGDLYGCMLEFFIAADLMIPFDQLLLHPVKSAPWFTPDKKNFDNFFWKWLKPRSIMIERHSSSKLKSAEETKIRMRSILDDFKGTIITQPECGRTRNKKNIRKSDKGHTLGKLGSYIGHLAVETNTPVLPIWMDDGEKEKQPKKELFNWLDLAPQIFNKQINIRIGKLMYPYEMGIQDPKKFTDTLEDTLLNLADQE